MLSKLTVAVLSLGLLAALPATAQSDNDLRNENQTLRTLVGDLQRELEAARQRIAELEQLVGALRRQIAAAGRSPAAPADPGPTEAEPVSIDESVPNASPRALLHALQESYREALEGLEPGGPGDRKYTTYMRALDRWTRRVNRELRSQIDWHVRIVPDSQYPVEFEAVDPQTHTILGDPFPVRLTRNVRKRLHQLEQRGELGVLQLKGVLVPKVTINPDRLERGTFDNPRLIGRFAEFGLYVEASSIVVPNP